MNWGDKKLALIIHNLKEGKDLQESKEISNEILNTTMKTLIYTVLSMYDNLSIRTIKLIREQKERRRTEMKLRDAYRELEQLAITDSLTGLYNRRHFESCFDRELNRAKRKKDLLSIISIDVDYFKLVNDTYGHHVGDSTLKNIAQCLRDVFKRANDLVFRVGGEEFIVMVTDETSEMVLQLAQKLQERILEMKMPNEKSDVSSLVTVSIGIVSHIPRKKDTFDSVMKIVDDRLYVAKKQGRNTIVNTD